MNTPYAVLDCLQERVNLFRHDIPCRTGFSASCAVGLAGFDGSTLLIPCQAGEDILPPQGTEVVKIDDRLW